MEGVNRAYAHGAQQPQALVLAVVGLALCVFVAVTDWPGAIITGAAIGAGGYVMVRRLERTYCSSRATEVLAVQARKRGLPASLGSQRTGTGRDEEDGSETERLFLEPLRDPQHPIVGESCSPPSSPPSSPPCWPPRTCRLGGPRAATQGHAS